ncbi:hypothetical protein VaNZ11_000948 [Volvox africanus]|uniref:Uncharacterized protein n=1 Tax=Volvox africanus TaxID=51714 RepID=A0ABQ5RNJ2_9CHLO|nr:hypothetical protein VaNZ11_000948 [Volvox africanus]
MAGMPSSLSVGAMPAARSGILPREPSFGGFGTGPSPAAVASTSLHAQGGLRQAGGALGPEASVASAPGQVYPPPPPAPLHTNPLRHSTPGLHGPPGFVSALRADAFLGSAGAGGDISSALLRQQAMVTPGPVGGGGGAAANTMAGLVGLNRGGVGMGMGITGYVHSMQHAQAAFTVERTALEARCRAAEEALTQSERRFSVEVERLQGRVSTLESGLAAERQLCGQLQEQLQEELKRLRVATEAETAARAAELAAKEMLAASNHSLELERRRAAEAAQQSTQQAGELSSRVAALEAERAGLEKQLLQEKDHASTLHKQLRDAQRQEQALMEKLGASEGARQQQEMRLEAAAEQVAAMRNELQLLNAKLAARDKQLLKHVQEIEETQLAALRSELAAVQSRLQRQEGLYAALRASVAAIHQALGPQALAAAFGYSESLLSGFTAGASEYGAVADRLLSQREVAEEDAAAVVLRVRELVTQTRNLYMASEKREVALTSETDQAMSALRQTNAEAEARLASCNTALRTATQRVEELTGNLQDSRNRCSELEGSLQAAQHARQAERRRCEELQTAVGEMQQEMAALRTRAADAEGAQRELSASREQALQLQHQLQELTVLAQRSTDAAEIKEERIRELRAALAAAMDTTTAAEGQTGLLIHEKQQALEALDLERRRSANLEAVAQSTEQQLDKIRSRADAVEASYRELCQQVVVAAKEAAAHARELQQQQQAGGVVVPPVLSGASPRMAASQLAKAADDSAAQLTALEGALERLARGSSMSAAGVTPTPVRGSWAESPLGSGFVQLNDQAALPQVVMRLLLGHIQQLASQQALAVQYLSTAQQHLHNAVHVGEGDGLPPLSSASKGAVAAAVAAHRAAGVAGTAHDADGSAAGTPAPAMQTPPLAPLPWSATLAVPLHELARKVAAASEEVLEAVTDISRREAEAEQRVDEITRELSNARQEAAQVAVLQGRLAACEVELEHVKATAQAEFGRVQGEVTRAFVEADKLREAALAEAEDRVRAAEKAAADAAAQSQAQAVAAEALAEARVRDAEAARSAAVALVTSLQAELAQVRSLLDSSRAEVHGMQEEQAAGLRHVASLNDHIRRLGEEVTRWRKAANPRTRDRLVLLAKVRVLRRKRTQLQESLAAEKHRANQLSSAADARRERIRRGLIQMRQLQIDNVQLSSRLQEAEARAARADSLVSRLEERRISVDQDRKSQTEKAAKLATQLADANKALESARRAEAATRKDMDRIMREQLEPQQRRTAAVLEELERAAEALQESQANATRLLQQGEVLRAELVDVKRGAEADSQQAQQRLAALKKEVTERDATIASLRQQVAAAQASAATAAALLPAISSGQLGDAAAVQSHLIGQLGQLQAANAELEARRTAVETELEVLRVRLSRSEAAGTAVALTPGAAVSGTSPATTVSLPSSNRTLVDLIVPGHAALTPHGATVLASSAKIDDGSLSAKAFSARDQDSVITGVKDQRIHELRAALTSVMSERSALQRELAAAREEGSAEFEAQAAHVRMLEDEVHRLAASLETAEKQLEEVTESARQTMLATEAKAAERVEVVQSQAREHLADMERRLREEIAGLEKRARDGERVAAEANARGEERLRQAERAREQLAQMQALHASAEEAVRQLSSQLRELQQGNSSNAQAAVAEVQQLQATADSLRLEVALAKDAAETYEAEIRRLTTQNEVAASQCRTMASQLQNLAEDLATARTRISTLQQELVQQKDECETLRRANDALQISLAAAEERHVDSEAQLLEAEAALSRQQGLVRQVQVENERLHEQFGELQQQLQQLTSERRAAVAAASAAAAAAARSPSKGGSPGFVSSSRGDTRSEVGSERGNHNINTSGANGPPGRREAPSPLGGLEARLLEAAVTDLQAKLDALQIELVGVEARAKEAEADAELLRTDLDGAKARQRAAEAKAGELQSRLEASLLGSAQGVSALKEQVLELELHLDEQRDREQAAQAALMRATERCDELQVALAEAERRAEELQHRCEDKELEVGVLQAQLASASAQRLAQQVEAQQLGVTHGSSGQTITSALELELHEKTHLVDALQDDIQAANARAEEAERELSELRSFVEAMRGEAQELERQRQSAALEAQLTAEANARLRADSSKLADRLSKVQNDLLEAQDGRDKTSSLLRAAEARLAEERSEGESLRRQLEAAASQGRGADLLWVQRVADLEEALSAARKQAAEAEDAVVEAAAAQVRSAGLETRAQDLEAALAEAETRAAAAADAEARIAGALAGQREAHRQEVTTLQLQVQGLQGRLAVCERQVADRDARLEGVGTQLHALRGHTEAFELQLKEVRLELRSALQENEALQQKIASMDQTVHNVEGGASVSGLSLSTSSHAPQQQLVGMLTENRDLLEKLSSTHSKLKQARAKLAQWEQELRSKDLEVERLRSQVAAAGGMVATANAADSIIEVLRSELQAYKAALAASQEEAAASAAAAAEAQARCEALSQRLQQDGERRASHSQASARAVEYASPSMLERLHQQQHQYQYQGGGSGSAAAPASAADTDAEDTQNTLHALMHKVRSQRSEIDTLSTELQAANAKRTELAKEAATLDQRLAEAEIRERDLAATAETLRQQLTLTQQQLENRQMMLQQLTSISYQGQKGQGQQQGHKNILGLLGYPSSSSGSPQVMWGTAGDGEGPEDGPNSASTSPRSQATRPYRSTITLSPSRGGAHPSASGGGGAASASSSYSQHQLLLAQQHQQQATKLERVVAMWRDACRAKDARVQELQADLATFSSQLERARGDASVLTAKVLERDQTLTSCQHHLELTRDSLGAQLQAAEEKLEAKAQRLAAVEDELQNREDELRDVRAQLQAAERSLMLVQAESGQQREVMAKTLADLAAATRQVAALQAEIQDLQQRNAVSRSGTQQMVEQVHHLQDQVNRTETMVGRLLFAARTALSMASTTTTARTAAAAAAAGGGAGADGTTARADSDGRSDAGGGRGGLGSVLSLASSGGSLGGSGGGGGGGGATALGGLPSSLRLLEELILALSEELQRRNAALVAAEAEATGLQGRLAAREEDAKGLETRLKSAQDSLTARLEEVSRLQTALRRKEADCEAVETEISAQIADYQRLKQRLLQQERDSSRLSSDQEALLRRSDELEATLAAKQEECALLMKKCAQLEEQLQAGRSAMTALQERVRTLDAHSEALQRNNQTAALARQDTAAALDAARADLRAASQQAAAYREQLEMRNNEVRELNSMLQAWEAMRLGKDAQIAALLERCKRHEEDAAEKARTIEALRRKLQMPGRMSLSGIAAPAGAGAAASTTGIGMTPTSSSTTTTPISMAYQQQQMQQQQQQPSLRASSGNMALGARHIHVHMHSPAVVTSPPNSGMSVTGPHAGR